MIQREGEGWRLAWDAERQPFSVLIGGDGWAVELTEAEARALRQAVADLVAQHGVLVDQVMEEEAISIELDRPPWWIGLDGDRHHWSLRVLLSPGPGQRGLEGQWSPQASGPFHRALQQFQGQP